MKGYWRQIHAQNSHVLNEDGIYPCLIEVVNHRLGGRQFTVVEDGVDSGINLYSELVGILAQLANVIDTVGYGNAGSMPRCADIYSGGTVVNGSNATL